MLQSLRTKIFLGSDRREQYCAFLWRLALALWMGGLAAPRAASASGLSNLGINYGMLGDNLLPPSQVVALLQSISVTKTRIYSADAAVLGAFANTGISILVGVGNEDVASLSSSLSYASGWVEANIAAFYPATQISGILVGNEVYSGTDAQLMANLLPAMENVYSALQAKGLSSQILVSTAHSLAILSSSFPPSQGVFVSATASNYLMPLLQFLSRTAAPFMINAYPYFAYKQDPSSVSLSYVAFEATSDAVTDPGTGHVYTNMLDAQVDAIYSAMAALGFADVAAVVSETGWPSAGDADEAGASVANAQAYNANLIARVASNQGTPLRPSTPLQVFVFALFNEDNKTGPTSERHYGLFYPDGTRVYDVGFGATSRYSVSYASSSSASSLRGARSRIWLLLVALVLAPSLTLLSDLSCFGRIPSRDVPLSAARSFCVGHRIRGYAQALVQSIKARFFFSCILSNGHLPHQF